MGKKWYKSKTVWSAIAAGIVAAASVWYGEASSIVGALIAVFSALGVYGRVVARENIE